MRFVAELYQMQMDGGRYFLHENPDQATSWDRAPIADLLRDERVSKVTGDQCSTDRRRSAKTQ